MVYCRHKNRFNSTNRGSWPRNVRDYVRVRPNGALGSKVDVAWIDECVTNPRKTRDRLSEEALWLFKQDERWS